MEVRQTVSKIDDTLLLEHKNNAELADDTQYDVAIHKYYNS